MSRKIKNSGLAELCAAADLQVADLACILQCHRSMIFYYTAGRKPLPRIEAGLAQVFKLSIPELRQILFTPQRAGFKRRRIHGASNRSNNQTVISKPLDTGHKMASYHLLIWRWTQSAGLPAREWRCKNFERYADDPEIQGLIEAGKHHRLAAIKIKKLPLNTSRAALFVN